MIDWTSHFLLFFVFLVDSVFLSLSLSLSGQTSIQCLLHWRFTLNDNGIIRGNGTWGAEEDERLRKLAPVFSSPSTGPRYDARLSIAFLMAAALSLGILCSTSAVVQVLFKHGALGCDCASLHCPVLGRMFGKFPSSGVGLTLFKIFVGGSLFCPR